MTLTVGSLFSGIGGLDLGLERAGMKVIWQSEIDPYACKVLKKHWPEVPNHGDIKQIDWRTVEPVDVICGGYPCQPFSTAGKRQGTDDPRHLWPWVRTAISELRPKYAILENVRGHLTMGGTQVIGELAEIGYDAQWDIVSAASVGAPHRRDRIIIVAYPTELFGNGSNNNARVGMESQTISQSGDSSRSENVAYPNDSRSRTSQRGIDTDRAQEVKGRQNVTQSWVGGRSTDVANDDSQRDGLNRSQSIVGQTHLFGGHNRRRETSDVSRQWWAVEPDVGRVADGIPNRVDRLRGLGNAVVPQVAEYIGRLITTSLDA
jgi:DNA (cytosine-5)-methyltransferase 1